ncbi:L,D-transpeptidase [Limnobaculum parvum]|uniref:L,D-transpeptidase n=1 Tax=Limnobaculum parvum TaxID=2172103 RepID=A0A2Y9U1E9_9GAMM|nr:L,D-transpeptidase [Limnobaculum parvum]AWH89928.1 L,D-transpeptidase [Limnobaculum parvum]
MLLVKRKIIKNLAVKCTLTALMAFPLGGCAADEDLNNQAPATISAEAATATAGESATIAETPAIEVPAQDPALVAQARDALMTALPAGVTLKFMPELSSVYAVSEIKSLWEDEKVQKQFEQQLAEMALAGIQPQFGQWAKLLTQPDITGMARDAILTDALLGYMHFVEGVKTNGNRWLYNNGAYKMAAPSVEAIAQWQQAVKDGNSEAFIQSLAPQNIFYSKMHDSLKPLVEDVQPWPQITLSKQSLRPGSSNKDVPALRDILARSGFIKGEGGNSHDATAEGGASSSKKKVSLVYSGELVDGVKRFQQMYGMEADGVIGDSTREALNMAPQTRAAILALNIQRLRLLPKDMSHGIFVNIPDYTLFYYVNNELVLESRVIVGSVKRKTPLMSSALNNVVVNPPWNVPVKLIREDLAPKAKRDVEYLKRGGYTVYSGWGKGATVVDPSTINWSAGGNYRLQQAPGRSNALGRFKFNMPNDDAIYLHDTPNHRLFDKNMRALSSGCIRVNKASELANILLNGVGWDDNKIQNTLKRGSTTYANIREEIPVQLYYMTSWVSNSGNPEYRTDIYGYDSAAQEGIKELPQVEKLLR